MEEAAQSYIDALREAERTAASVEPEAQLTVPVKALLEAVAAAAGMGHLVLLREAQLPGVRPDFVASHQGSPCGWVELKAPGHSVDGPTWKGREKGQWALLAELDALIVSDGEHMVLYQQGQPLGRATLPVPAASGWDPNLL